MKKNQYVISIVAGLLVGAVIALLVGNLTTAILAGVVTAGVTAWVGSLQWSEAREFSIKVAGMMKDSDEFTRDFNHCIDKICRIISAIGRAVRWLLWIAPKRLVTDVYVRKMAIGMLVYCLPGGIISGNIIFSVLSGVLYSLFIWIEFYVSYPITPEKIGKIQNIFLCKDKDSKFLRSYNEFFYGWFFQLLEDDRGAMVATARMLYIRTGNALRIIAYPFVLIPWGFVALANNRTGIAALSTMFLSGIHLSAAYFVGGIDAGNVNFWLSLAIAMMVGAVIGRKIGEMKEETFKIPPLPAIRFRHQVELLA